MSPTRRMLPETVVLASKTSLAIPASEASADELDAGAMANHHAIAMVFARPPGEDMLPRYVYLVGFNDGTGELVFKHPPPAGCPRWGA